ncbi:MAG: hypothetical protein DRI57_05515 [Deltaproteobacteria bacterium]|nr:MAG: hypothetical protein DRI57_05515 [Deltaproteobacteria bacterium]
MSERMKMLKEVAICADKFPKKTESLGGIATEAFGNKHKAQIKSLENIANTALKVSDVLDYIKRQTGKSEQDKRWKSKQLGERLLNEIREHLKKDRDTVCKRLNITAEENHLEVYLLLIREFVRQVVIHYEYEISKL